MAGGVLVLMERLKGVVAEAGFEALGAGRSVADALKIPLWAVLAGGPVPDPREWGAADGLLVLEDPSLEMPPPETVVGLLQDLLKRKQASLVLVGGTNWAYGIGSQLAFRLKWPCVNFCKGCRVEGGAVVWTSQLLGGKILAEVRLPDNRGVAVLYPGAFPAEAGRRQGAPPVEKVAGPVGSPRVTFKRYLEPPGGDVDITRQDILVSVGRGIQSKDNIALAEELARVLGGAVCASRPVVDQGWLPLTRQVGKSGMTVRPKLYLALGISGAPEHQEGMKGASCIIAVNTDPGAPIFGTAHYGAVADCLELLPLLKDEVEKRKGGR